MQAARLGVRIGLAGAIGLFASSLVASAASAVPNLPLISSVTFSGSPGDYTLTVLGHRFGSPTVALPFVGDVGNFRIQDDAQLGAPSSGEWGYSGDVDTLTYLTWTSTEIKVSGAGLSPGDAFFVVVQNTASERAASWGGNVPGGAAGGPVITKVGLSSLGDLPSLRIAVTGSGFGPPPKPLPFVGDVDQFSFSDPEVHCNGASALTAGGSYFGTRPPDTVTLRYLTWTDTEIVVAGFRGSYGSGCNVVHEGDAVAVSVWASSATSPSGPQTAHQALILYPGISR